MVTASRGVDLSEEGPVVERLSLYHVTLSHLYSVDPTDFALGRDKPEVTDDDVGRGNLA